MNDIKLNENEILVLRNCSSDGSFYSYFWDSDNNFKQPFKVGDIVESSSWNGFHGLPWGTCDCDKDYFKYYMSLYDSVLWMLLAVNIKENCICLGGPGESRFETGRIVFIGEREKAIEILQEMAPDETNIIYSNQNGGDNVKQFAGYSSEQYAGDYVYQKAGNKSKQFAGNNAEQKSEYNSNQTAGNCSKQDAKDFAIQMAEDGCVQVAENNSIQTAWNSVNQTAGYLSTQNALDNSIQCAGDQSTQISGNNSNQKVGDYSKQITGNYSVQTAGIGTIQIVKWYCEEEKKLKVSTRIVDDTMADKSYYVKDGIWTEI